MTPTTKATPKTKPAAKVSHAKAKPAQELPTISTVKLVPLALIDIEAQVRTVFDDESIQSLADDISERGLLQPILLNPHGNRFTLIAGERRVRACKLLQLTDIPALVTKASSGDALLMQLAENIQREDLDLGDQVKAIRQLHDNLKSVTAVANTVKKSPAWVSKRLALSHPDLSFGARQLMEDCITEDVEILNCLSSLNAISWPKGQNLDAAIRNGTATRETARQALKDAKAAKKEATDPAERERLEAERQAENKRHAADEAKHQKERTKGTGPLFVEWALNQLQASCASPNEDSESGATDFLNELAENQRASLVIYLQAYQETAKNWSPNEWALCLTPWDSDAGYLEQFAAVMALKGQEIDNLYALATILEAANREVE